MPTITVVRQFMLQLEPVRVGGSDETPVFAQPEKIVFVPGVHDVTDEVADHWYTKMHIAGYVEPVKGPGTAEYQAGELQSPTKADPSAPSHPAPQDATHAPRTAAPPPSATRSTPRG